MTETHPPVLDDARVRDAVVRAREMVADAGRREAAAPRSENARRTRVARLVRDPRAAEFSLALTDQVARIGDPRQAARRFVDLVHESNLDGMALLDRLLLWGGALVAERAPRQVMSAVIRRLRYESRAVILPAEDPGFVRHVARRRAEGVRVNVNVLGEAILGDEEARTRLDRVLALLARPDVDYVSVKISSVCPNVSSLAFDDTVAAVATRLRELYRAARAHTPAKFVNLDMEEYRDLALTTAVFRGVLSEPEFHGLEAGIVLQAYLPDSHGEARAIADWALERRLTGGAPIKVRVVKGANLAMERVDAEIHGWPLAPYASKAEVDASYKALLASLLDPRYDGAVRVGLASHNLFDVAWGFVLREELDRRGQAGRLEFEMLEGMAPKQAAAVRDRSGGLLMYAPVATRDDFAAAIAYLVRRLDENTEPENFLARLFDIAPGNAVFDAEATKFVRAVAGATHVSTAPRRTQNRLGSPGPVSLDLPFANAADTDFSQEPNRRWIAQHLAAPRDPRGNDTTLGVADVDAAVARASAAGDVWRGLDPRERARLINRIGDAAEARRGELIAAMARYTGKTVLEGDPEVSEGVDMCRYYAREMLRWNAIAAASSVPPTPLGTVVVAPPWNFPFAIPMGGVTAALAAGSAVILKPAPEATDIGALVAACCADAGLPDDVVRFLPCPDGDVGQRLITHPQVGGVILTGGLATAQMFLEWRPELRLHAETSGKNAMVISATADIDLALRDLVRSAFGHAGQKCSAASLAIVDASLYDDPHFRARLRDAAASLRPGPALDLRTDVGPLIGPPGESLERALTRLDAGETWLLEPRRVDGHPHLWSPGVRLGVRPGSWFHQTECFGPVLGVMRATSLDEAIAFQNGVRFGLTAGLHSLDPHEISRWLETVEAGNLYVNRSTTGAIVRRQPFGGWRASAVGPTAKAGGPNYVARLMDWPDDGKVSAPEAARGYRAWMDAEGLVESDPSGLAAESNAFRYRPLPGGVFLRIGRDASPRAAELARAAAHAAGCRVVVSDARDEDDAAAAAHLDASTVDRVRLLGHDHDAVRRAAHAAAIPVDAAEPVTIAAVEMTRWLHEQAVSVTRHRHGHLPAR